MTAQALACPGCKNAVGDTAVSTQERIWGEAFTLSIYFMLFAVHVLIGFAIYKVHKMIKSEDKRHGVDSVEVPATTEMKTV